MKRELKWIIPVVGIVVGALLTIGGGVIAIPWKLDGRYAQKEVAAKEHAAITVRANEQYSTMLERIGGMDRTYVQSRLDDLRWKLMTLKRIKQTRRLTPPEQEMFDDLKREIKRLKEKLSKMR